LDQAEKSLATHNDIRSQLSNDGRIPLYALLGRLARGLLVGCGILKILGPPSRVGAHHGLGHGGCLCVWSGLLESVRFLVKVHVKRDASDRWYLRMRLRFGFREGKALNGGRQVVAVAFGEVQGRRGESQWAVEGIDRRGAGRVCEEVGSTAGDLGVRHALSQMFGDLQRGVDVKGR
jgi:hypothetical protein